MNFGSNYSCGCTAGERSLYTKSIETSSVGSRSSCIYDYKISFKNTLEAIFFAMFLCAMIPFVFIYAIYEFTYVMHKVGFKRFNKTRKRLNDIRKVMHYRSIKKKNQRYKND